MPVTNNPVLVTGATGYIAAEIVKQLLDAGYQVRGTTRNVESAKEQGHLTGLPGASERLELVAADLNHDEAFTPHMVDCEYVLHVASPYVLEVEDPQRDLVDPAVSGTLSVLKSANVTPTVKRVVLTSSFAAITEGPSDEVRHEGHWNEASSLAKNAYAFSKTQAEKAAWDFIESEDRHFDLVVMNPSGVIGPSIVSRLNQTQEFAVGMTNGTSPAIISIAFPIVDVRDVAKAHILAMENPTASGRYLLASGSPPFRRYVEIMREEGLDKKYKLPKLGLDNKVGNVLVRGLMLTQSPGVRGFINSNLGAQHKVSTAKVEDELGMTWIDPDVSIRDTVRDLDEWGHLGKK